MRIVLLWGCAGDIGSLHLPGRSGVTGAEMDGPRSEAKGVASLYLLSHRYHSFPGWFDHTVRLIYFFF